MTPQIRRALDAAYEVFAKYGTPLDFGLSGSLHLRDLTIEDWRALDKQHDVGVWLYSDNGELLRYFLPRWLEWLSQAPTEREDLGDWEFWDLGYRLAQAKWREWPTPEVAALRAVVEALIRAEINENNGAPSSLWPREAKNLGEEGERLGLTNFSVSSGLLNEFLYEVGEAPLYLELWLDANLPQLARWLWFEDFHRFKDAREWVISSRLESELEAAFFADSDGPNAELFSRSIELVRSLRAL